MKPLWQTPAFQEIAGKTLRPGGLSTTREALSWLLSHNLLPTGLAVDGGTGYGESLGLLQSLGFLCLGLDTNTASLPHLLAKNCYAAQADISHLPLAKQSTAIILLECVLSLLADPKTALAEAHRILSPAGIALVSDLTVEGTPSCSTSSCLAGARSAPSGKRFLPQTTFVFWPFLTTQRP